MALPNQYANLTGGQEDQNLSSLFDQLNQISSSAVSERRAGGTTGGGAEVLEGNMDPNPLAMFNPYLGKNVTSFANGGMYEMAANQAIAQNQLSGLVANLIDRRMPMIPAMANKGMKMNRYDNGGNVEITDKTTGETRGISSKSQEYKDLMPGWYNPDQSPLQNLLLNPYRPVGEGAVQYNEETGERTVLDPSSRIGGLTPERFPNYVPGSSPSWWPMEDQYAPINTPIANRGMKMKKRYTQGGRF